MMKMFHFINYSGAHNQIGFSERSLSLAPLSPAVEIPLVETMNEFIISVLSFGLAVGMFF